jgi:hypothetical protein
MVCDWLATVLGLQQVKLWAVVYKQLAGDVVWLRYVAESVAEIEPAVQNPSAREAQLAVGEKVVLIVGAVLLNVFG